MFLGFAFLRTVATAGDDDAGAAAAAADDDEDEDEEDEGPVTTDLRMTGFEGC